MIIFLIYKYEKTGDKDILKLITEWLDFHNKYIDESTGFFGEKNKFHDGMQNSFHQLVIYTYLKDKKFFDNSDYPSQRNALSSVLRLQDKKGFFSKTPGGHGCYEYDAVDYIVNLGLQNGYIDDKFKNALCKTQNAILSLQNEDGGFPMTEK